MTPPRPTLWVTCGLPASGKSTWALAQALKYQAVIVTADAIRTDRIDAERVFTAVHRRLTKVLDSNTSAIADTCALQSSNRLSFMRIGKASSATCVLVYFDIPVRICMERAQRRGGMGVYAWAEQGRLAVRLRKTVTREGWDSIVCVSIHRK